METLVTRAYSQGELINNFMVNTNKTKKENRTCGFIKGRREILNTYWTKFQGLHDQILDGQASADAAKSEKYFEQRFFFEVEKLYGEHLGALNDLLETQSPNQGASNSSPENLNNPLQPKCELKLPRITIPIFSGDYTAWTSFHDLFDSLVVKNKNLTNVQRLHHLKSFLSGDAEVLLRKYSVQDNNFEPAWELLKKRFANKRLLINTYFDRFLSQQRVTTFSNADGLRHLYDTSLECISSIRNLLENEQLFDSLVLHIITQKLDVKTLEAWEKSIQGEENPPSIEQFSEFLDDTCRTIELVNTTKKHNYEGRQVTNQFAKKSNDIKPVKSFHMSSSTTSSDRTSVCSFCNRPHATHQCFKFRVLNLADRIKFINSKSICSRCLSSDHSSSTCTANIQCMKCKKQDHHTLLHPASKVTSPSSLTTSSFDRVPSSNIHTLISQSHGPSQSVVKRSETHAFRRPHSSLLATALISVKSAQGVPYTLRALLDQGSESSLICYSVVKLLNLKIHKSTVTLKGIGQVKTGESNGYVNLSFNSLYDNNTSFNIDALVLSCVTGKLPSYSFDPTDISYLKDINLADPEYYKSNKVDIVLGADIYGEILLPGNNLLKYGDGKPIAQLTQLGWILSGKCSSKPTSSSIVQDPIEILSCFSYLSVCDQLKQFWELEEVTSTRNPTSDEIYCETHYQSTHVRLPSGRYEVHLPFISENNPEFGSTRSQCISRLKQIQKRLNQNPKLSEQYNSFMNDYLVLGHMIPVSPSYSASSFYLPHHAVLKETSTTTKLRVVFDASCKASDGLSLNDKLHTGPTIQQDLMDILLRWRKHKYVITGDVEKMYRQISVTQNHRRYQRIVWQNSNNNLQDFELSTVTYGTSSAPYLAIRTLKQLAKDEELHYPLASRHTLSDMYVDDFISGASTIEETKQLYQQMQGMFNRGCFKLRKWSSNSDKILSDIPLEDRETISIVDMCKDLTLKTLGVYWNPQDDQFQFRIKLAPVPPKSTKRSLLSDVARLFDPLGWLAPVVISAKVLFQQLWLQGLDWDDELPPNILKEWLKLRNLLPSLEKITIPRWINTSDCTRTVELHGFCDASVKAYAAVIYIRTIEEGKIISRLLTSKTRVAPIKQVSLPHLELCGATLLAKLMSRVSSSMMIDGVNLFAWTDSTIVLAWLQNQTHKQTFVANRVSTILSHINAKHWSHVRSNDNAADIASRGICPSKLQDYMIWWQGPKWLQESAQNWPRRGQGASVDHQPSSQIAINSTIHHLTMDDDDPLNLIKKFSELKRLIRITAYCLRFAKNCLNSSKNRRTTFLDADEHESALKTIIKYVQLNTYSSEINNINNNKSPKNMSFASLNPFMSNDGLIRVGGRLRNASLEYDHKFPILLPRDNDVSKMIIQKVHIDSLHGGPKLTLSNLRQKYWIPSARSMIRKILHKCNICHRHSIRIRNQIMGTLPAARVTPSKAFSHSGVDYAGPVDIRLSKHKGKGTFKGYIAVFVCLATKAIHLELTSDLTASAFIAAFKRFTSRRGHCSNIYSDNGTNFIGANKHIQQDFENAIHNLESELAAIIAGNGTKWHFIPPSSPHFGGLWEASVKSMKFHLKRIIGNKVLTYEEFNTLLVQIEGTLNSRPLCQLSDEIDLEALTPAHLLIGGPITSMPQPSLLNYNENRLDRWKLLVKLHQDFWKAWSNDYLADLQQRPKKWSKQQRNLQVGDIVIVKNEQMPPSAWLLARVIEVHPGEDGIVRVATVQHKSGQFKRPVSKLSLLPSTDLNSS